MTANAKYDGLMVGNYRGFFERNVMMSRLSQEIFSQNGRSPS